ncbi:hypothetical protein Celaphus_00012513 [Cervus elaphus hippelaphus]|uniref:Uncharacterized protein n=1 Tax=Cervus elaphus hippelaphus TaxID=46360 RepID=A0A212CJJ5_CEREH|nr:hypothetical protein Celaphus_00012513 [Cervus elaphus hippelaphus]
MKGARREEKDDQVPEEEACPKEQLQKARTKFIYEKAKHYHKACRQMYRTEIQMTMMAQKVPSMYHGTEIGTCHQGQRYPWCEHKGLKSVAASLPLTDLQWHLCEAHMLGTVEPYIVWGYPNRKSRGYGKINKKRIALMDNMLIARSLGNTASSAWRI